MTATMIDPHSAPDPRATAPRGGDAGPGPDAAASSRVPADARQPRVLVVDDEPPIVDLVTGYLEREGWAVKTAGDGLAALEAIESWGPDAVVLDLMLPGVDGVEVCRRMRAFSDAYVLMLTARSEEIDRIVGLTVGADDYMAKPFSPRELVARMKALLRRPRVAVSAGGALPDGLEVDVLRRTAKVDGSALDLTVLEFDILAVVAREPGIVHGRQTLLDEVWGDGYIADHHLVDVHVANLRRKLGDDPASPRFVETVRGVGYRLREGT